MTQEFLIMRFLVLLGVLWISWILLVFFLNIKTYLFFGLQISLRWINYLEACIWQFSWTHCAIFNLLRLSLTTLTRISCSWRKLCITLVLVLPSLILLKPLISRWGILFLMSLSFIILLPIRIEYHEIIVLRHILL